MTTSNHTALTPYLIDLTMSGSHSRSITSTKLNRATRELTSRLSWGVSQGLFGMATVLLAVGLSAGSALADGKKDCTLEPETKWQTLADAKATAVAAGHDVRGAKVSGTCYEVYAMSIDRRKVELFYHPVELKLMQTIIK